jgi:omega-hydroxy-beta-dihydromenaquinone-9 sulfotransferase
LEGARRIVLKPPYHTARLHILREMFPEAKFIHIVQDP